LNSPSSIAWLDFLQSLPFVDPNHLGYYGLSYGGYSAIWMPPLEPRLKLTVISAHFNDWQTMLTDSTRQGALILVVCPDEDFYNWNVLNRFVHAQIIAAMWPRPVCIEYGSEDQVTTRRLAPARLAGGERLRGGVGNAGQDRRRRDSWALTASTASAPSSFSTAGCARTAPPAAIMAAGMTITAIRISRAKFPRLRPDINARHCPTPRNFLDSSPAAVIRRKILCHR
jgi:hypothetical protein